MRKTVPTAKLCQHSVPYWDEEMSILHKERMRVKETCQQFRATWGFIPWDTERKYHTTDNTFKRRLK